MHRIAACTAIGPRDTLEDVAIGMHLTRPGASESSATALLVFDGVGGLACGDVASAVGRRHVLMSLADALSARGDLCESNCDSQDDFLDLLVKALSAANDAILAGVEQDARLQGMSTTVVAGLIVDGVLRLAWAGDSRCYRCGAGRIEQLTEDHTESERLIRAGDIRQDEAMQHDLAHVITNWMGKPFFDPQTCTCVLAPGDILVLCTDGLTDVLDSKDLATECRAYRAQKFPFDQLPNRLVGKALERNTQDNVTCLTYEYQPSQPLLKLAQLTCTGAYPAALAVVRSNLFLGVRKCSIH